MPPAAAAAVCHKYTMQHLTKLQDLEGSQARLRTTAPDSENPYVTDNGNYIVDLVFETGEYIRYLPGPCLDPASLACAYSCSPA